MEAISLCALLSEYDVDWIPADEMLPPVGLPPEWFGKYLVDVRCYCFTQNADGEYCHDVCIQYNDGRHEFASELQGRAKVVRWVPYAVFERYWE